MPRIREPLISAFVAATLAFAMAESCMLDSAGLSLPAEGGGGSGAATGGSITTSDPGGEGGVPGTGGLGGLGGMGGSGGGGEGGAGGQGGSGGGILSSPCNSPDCILWLRGDLGVTHLLNNVSVWEDQSGSSAHAIQGDVANQPALVVGGLAGQDALDFTRAESDWMGLPTLAGVGANYTIMAVLEQRAESTVIQLLLSSLASADFAITPVTPSAQLGAFIADVWFDVAMNVAGPQIITWVFWGAGNQLFIYRGQTLIGTMPYYTTVKFGIGTTTLGKYRSGLQHHIDALIAELVIYQAPLDTTELAPIWQYLEDRYSL